MNPRYKRLRRRRPRRQVRRRGIRRPRRGGNLVVFNPRGHPQLPMPPRYRCKFTIANVGYFASGVAAGRMCIKLNSSYLPFNTSADAIPNPLGGLVSGTYCVGYRSIVNANLYDLIRVLGCKIQVEFLPQALTDTVECTVTPGVNNISVPATTFTAMAQPYTKQHFFSSSKQNARVNSITSYAKVSRLLGVSTRAIMDDLSGNWTHVYNSDPNTLCYWVVNWACPDVINLATNLEYRITLTYYCECYDENANLLG